MGTLESISKRKEPEKSRDAEQKTNIIMPKGDFWVISNVFYNEMTQDYALSKKLLPCATQDVHAQNRINAKQNNDFYCGDMPLNYAVFKALYYSPESEEKEEIRKFIKNSMRVTWLTALTRIQNNPSGELDKIIHNYKIPNEEYFKEVDLVGHIGKINLEDNNVLKALLLTNNFEEVNEIFKWINNTPTYIWRLNLKPEKTEEIVGGFTANFDRADLYCNRDPSNANDSLGYALLDASKA
jgi:hypothetical protein